MSTAAYPVHVEARLEAHLSRWRWLVKWLLLVPHYVVLMLLWVAFSVLSVVAFFAILFTGHYPRSIFDFNVGVLRWSWRVAYYSYGALGTDRYPPFSLHEAPDYPAHLEIDYPARLSRGLVLVKWWLLALPQYLVVGIFLSGVTYTVATVNGHDEPVLTTGLIGLLVLVAAAVLLFTGRYPQAVFDLLLGLNRWVLRVTAYATLMTDQYPPFRLDQGGADPDGHLLVAGSPPAAPPAGAAAPPLAAPASPTRWGAGRVIALVVGCLVAATGLATGAAALALSVTGQVARDQDGFLMAPSRTLTTSTYAMTSSAVDLRVDDGLPGLAPSSLIGDARVTAQPQDTKPLFLGVAATQDVQRWLAGVQHAVVSDVPGSPAYRTEGTSAPATRPGLARFWTATSAGTGQRTLTWKAESGDWTVVLMNADGSPAVSAQVRVGATLPVLDWATSRLWWTTVVLLALGTLVITLSVVVGRSTPPTSPTGDQPAPPTGEPVDRAGS